MTPVRITHSSRVCVVRRRQRRRRQKLTLDGGAKNKGKSPGGPACYGTLCVCVGVCFFAHNKSKSRVIVCPFFYPFARAHASPFVFSLNYPSPAQPLSPFISVAVHRDLVTTICATRAGRPFARGYRRATHSRAQHLFFLSPRPNGLF